MDANAIGRVETLDDAYARLVRLWAEDHWSERERRGIWLAYEDHIFDECLERLDMIVSTPLVARRCTCSNVFLYEGQIDYLDTKGWRHTRETCIGPALASTFDVSGESQRTKTLPRDAYAKRFAEILAQLDKITNSKNANYANDADAFANFRLIEHLSNGRISTLDGLLTRMSDKLQRLVNLAGGATNNHESFADNCQDLAIYAIILMIADESRR